MIARGRFACSNETLPAGANLKGGDEMLLRIMASFLRPAIRYQPGLWQRKGNIIIIERVTLKS